MTRCSSPSVPSTDKKLGLPGEDADGVLSAVQFLRSVGKDEIIDLTGKEVVVIGGGNVSMDAVRTAKRLGAKKVSILYRRRRNDMTALPGEIEGAIAEGIEIVTLKAPASLDVGEDHKIHGIYATPQMISAIKDGRASVKPTRRAGCLHTMRHPHQGHRTGYRVRTFRKGRNPRYPAARLSP